MGRHESKGWQTRFICAYIGTFVFSCLLSLSFVNVAYAATFDLPGGSDSVGGSEYNPNGYLLGDNGAIFNSEWTSEKSIFAQQLASPELQPLLMQILTAINADLQREANNYLYVIRTSIKTIETNAGYIRENTLKISSNTAGILQELNQDSRFVTGNETDTHTIRWYIKQINDKSYTIQQHLNSIKTNTTSIFKELLHETNSDFGDRHTIRYYIINIYNVLLSVQSSNSNHLANIDTYSQQISTYLGNIYTDVHAMRQNFDASISSVNDSLLNVTTALGSGGYIGQQLASIASKLDGIGNSLSSINTMLSNAQQYYLIDSSKPNERTYFFRVLPISLYDPNTNRWTNDVRNYLKTIANKTQVDYSQALQGITDALGSGGYIGHQLASVTSKLDGISNSLSSINTMLSNAQQYYVDLNDPSQRYYFFRVLPISLYDTYTNKWTSDVRNYLKTISQIDYTQAFQGITDALGSGGYIGQQLASIASKLDGIGNSLSSINTMLSNAQQYYLIDSSKPNERTYFFRVLPISLYDPNTNRWTTDVRNYLKQIEDDTNLIGSHLETIIELIRNINLNVSVNVPANAPQLIGDFDNDLFSRNIEGLNDRLNAVAPFGAVNLMTAEIGILSTVPAIETPSLVMPFEFFEKNAITIDVSWLDDAKLLFQFVIVFLFVHSLLMITMKYVRNETTS